MINLLSIKTNPNNPRVIKDDKFKKLVESIRQFPRMMELRPIVVDENGIALGGNMRLQALRELEYEEVPANWVKKVNDLTDEQKREFIIKDNVGFGEWDWDTLANEWDAEQLEEWGLDVPDFKAEDDKDLSDRIVSEYKIEITCRDEKHQEQTYNKLIEQGYECRILNL
jgi:ParB-like chromosome segregation protein Spo0J